MLLLHPLGASPADVACYFVDLGGDATLSSVVRALGRLLEQVGDAKNGKVCKVCYQTLTKNTLKKQRGNFAPL